MGQAGASDSSPSPMQTKKKGDKMIDLSWLEEDSIFCLLELMMVLLDQKMTEEEFFKDICFDQEIKYGNDKK